MNPVITFFRDTLDGTTYVIVCSISAVLLCACIGYLAEKRTKNKNVEEETTEEQASQTPVEVGAQSTPQPLENITESIPQEQSYQGQTQAPLDTQTTTQMPTTQQQTNDVNSAVTPQSQPMPQPGEIFPPMENQISQTLQQPDTTMQYQQPTSQTVDSTVQMPQQQLPQETNQVLPQQGEIFPPVENQIPNAQINNVMPPMETANLETPQVPETIDNQIAQQEEQPIETIENAEQQDTTTQMSQPQMPQATNDPQPQIPTIQ